MELLDGRAGVSLELPGWERKEQLARAETWVGPAGVTLRLEHHPAPVLVDPFLLDDHRQDLRLVAAERGGGLLECEPILEGQGVLGVIKLPLAGEGLRFEAHGLIPVSEGHVALRLEVDDPTGRRRERELAARWTGPAADWARDPYGAPYQRPARDREFARHRPPADLLVRTEADDPAHDPSFRDHGLSRLHAALRALVSGFELRRPSLVEVESDTATIQGVRLGLPLGFLAEDALARGQVFRRRSFAGRTSALRVEVVPKGEALARSADEARRRLPELLGSSRPLQGPRALERTVGRYPGVYAELELEPADGSPLPRYAVVFVVPWRDGAGLLLGLTAPRDDWARANRDLEAVVCCLTPWEDPEPAGRDPDETSDDTHKFAHVSLNGLRRVYRILCRLAHCDGEVDPRERTSLETFCRRFKISQAEASALEAEARENERLRIGRKPAERALLIDTMLGVVSADRTLHPAEERRLLKLARAVELPEEALRRLIEQRLRD